MVLIWLVTENHTASKRIRHTRSFEACAAKLYGLQMGGLGFTGILLDDLYNPESVFLNVANFDNHWQNGGFNSLHSIILMKILWETACSMNESINHCNTLIW